MLLGQRSSLEPSKRLVSSSLHFPLLLLSCKLWGWVGDVCLSTGITNTLSLLETLYRGIVDSEVNGPEFEFWLITSLCDLSELLG